MVAMNDVGAPGKLIQSVDDDMAPLTKRIPLWPDHRDPDYGVMAGPSEAIGELFREDLCPGAMSKE